MLGKDLGKLIGGVSYEKKNPKTGNLFFFATWQKDGQAGTMPLALHLSPPPHMLRIWALFLEFSKFLSGVGTSCGSILYPRSSGTHMHPAVLEDGGQACF